MWISKYKCLILLLALGSHTPLLVPQQHTKINYFPNSTGRLKLQPVDKIVGYRVRIKGFSEFSWLQFQINKALGKEPSIDNRFIKLYLSPDEHQFDHYYYFRDGPGVYQVTIWGNKEDNTTFISLCTFICVSNSNLPPNTPELSINKQIISFVESVMGKTVGRGECWDLAQMALDFNSAEWQRTLQFGIPLNPQQEAILPGDIIQMTSVKLRDGVKIEYYGLPKHTAIVYKVLSPNNFIIAHQNVNNKRFVLKSKFNLMHLEKGKVQFFRPQAGLIEVNH